MPLHSFHVHTCIFGKYHMAQNVGGRKHWQIPLKTTLTKNIGDLSLINEVTVLEKTLANEHPTLLV